MINENFNYRKHYMTKKELVFVGWINKGKVPVVGETVKNQYLISELQKYCKVIPLDFYQKNRHPWIYLQALWTFLLHPHASIVLSTSAKNVYSMLKVFKALGVKRNIIHWVVGGAFGNLVKEGVFDTDVFNYVSFNLVQCHAMVTQLKECGITNAKYVSNFKDIKYYPPLEKYLEERRTNKIIRFVYLSRIHPDKGCNYIFEAVKILNQAGFEDKFIVDFYGKPDEKYKNDFLNQINHYKNVSYNGVLNLREKEGYDTLASYHAMLFPTFHSSEGFAGVFIDAFIAGLPVLASDWAYNSESLQNGKNGIIYPVHDVNAIVETMNNCIIGKTDLFEMARNARAEAAKYEAKNVINEDYLKEIGLL